MTFSRLSFSSHCFTQIVHFLCLSNLIFELFISQLYVTAYKLPEVDIQIHSDFVRSTCQLNVPCMADRHLKLNTCKAQLLTFSPKPAHLSVYSVSVSSTMLHPLPTRKLLLFLLAYSCKNFSVFFLNIT